MFYWFFFLFKVLSQEETEEEKQKSCSYLNSIRANYTICCEYPILVMWRWQYNYCQELCNYDAYNCCSYECSYRLLGVLVETVNEDGTFQIDVDWLGLVYSFLNSVGNDTLWTPVVHEAVKRCHDQFSNTGEYYCYKVPYYLFTIMDCAYIENYLRCAKWNPYGIKECDITYQYVKKCFG